jgi:single-stranded DNA-binding protein
MAARKLYDLAVKTGSYQDRNGETKGRYENIGSVLQLDDGGKVILIKRTFNPAGVPFKDGSDQIMVSMFEPKDREQAPAPAQAAHQKAKSNGYQPQDTDDIPF